MQAFTIHREKSPADSELRLTYLPLVCLLAAISGQAGGTDVLNAENHPVSPVPKSGFRADLVPLETTISWTQRFLGDARFGEEAALRSLNSMKTSEIYGSDHVSIDSPERLDGVGVIREVRAESGRLKIAHGDIEKLGMPAMTMIFRLSDAGLARDLEIGQEVEFAVEHSADGLVITALRRAASTTSYGSMDAEGMILHVDREAGRVRIHHHPILKLGMPEMTMTFLVESPELLSQIEPGRHVLFNVEHSSAGLLITGLRPVEK